MIAEVEQDIYQSRANFVGRRVPNKERARARAGGVAAAGIYFLSYCNKEYYVSNACFSSASEAAVENGVSKWNYAQKKRKNAKKGLCNPLIFREIPRNYGCQIINFFVRYGKSGHLSFKEGAQFAAIRTSQVVDFWRNLAYSHKKIEGGGIYDLRALGLGWRDGRLFWLPPKAKEGWG